jgi:hypothetical protein
MLSRGLARVKTYADLPPGYWGRKVLSYAQATPARSHDLHTGRAPSHCKRLSQEALCQTSTDVLVAFFACISCRPRPLEASALQTTVRLYLCYLEGFLWLQRMQVSGRRPILRGSEVSLCRIATWPFLPTHYSV